MVRGLWAAACEQKGSTDEQPADHGVCHNPKARGGGKCSRKVFWGQRDRPGGSGEAAGPLFHGSRDLVVTLRRTGSGARL